MDNINKTGSLDSNIDKREVADRCSKYLDILKEKKPEKSEYFGKIQILVESYLKGERHDLSDDFLVTLEEDIVSDLKVIDPDFELVEPEKKEVVVSMDELNQDVDSNRDGFNEGIEAALENPNEDGHKDLSDVVFGPAPKKEDKESSSSEVVLDTEDAPAIVVGQVPVEYKEIPQRRDGKVLSAEVDLETESTATNKPEPSVDLTEEWFKMGSDEEKLEELYNGGDSILNVDSEFPLGISLAEEDEITDPEISLDESDSQDDEITDLKLDEDSVEDSSSDLDFSKRDSFLGRLRFMFYKFTPAIALMALLSMHYPKDNDPTQVSAEEVAERIFKKSSEIIDSIPEETPLGFSNYLEYLESQDEWSEKQAKRVGLVLDSGDPKKGFGFVTSVKDDEERKDWKVKSLIPEDLQTKKGNWSKEDIERSNCCYLEDGKPMILSGFYYDKNVKKIVSVSGEYLNSLSKWSKSKAKYSGLLDANDEPVNGFRFLEEVTDGEKRKNWKIVRIESEDSKKKNLDKSNSTEKETGLDKVEGKFINLWDSYKKGEVAFMYFDITNNFKYIGEAKYKGKRDLKKIQKIHDDFRKGKEDRVLKFEGMHSIVPFNSMFKYDVVGNQYLNIKSPEDVHKVYLDKYSKDMKAGFDAFKSDLSKVSKMAGLMEGDDAKYFYDMIVAQIAQESSFNSDAKSKAGADGIAQITEPAITDIHNMIMSSRSRQVNFAVHRSKEGSKEMIRMLTFYDLLLKRVGSNNPKEFSEMLKDKRLFKEVIFPILVTGYNQGHLNARSMFDFLIDNHNSKKLDASYYVDGKRSLKNLNSDVVLYLLTRSYDVARSTSKDLGKLDKDTERHQSVLVKKHFGEDGVSYYVKISAIKTYFEKFKDKKPAKVVMKKVESSNDVPSNNYKKALVLDVKNVKPLSYYKGRSLEGFLKGTGLYEGQKLYSKSNFKEVFDPISWHFYEDVDEIKTTFGDDYKYIRLAKDKWGSVGLDQKLYGPDKKVIGIYEIDEYERMLILKENLNVYIQIAKEVHQKTGKYLEINSTFRDKVAQKKHGKVKKTFHETGKAIDLREATFDSSERKEVEKIFAKYAAAGYLTFRTHGGHYHLVFHGERYREALKKYFAESDLTKAKRELKVEVARIDKTSKKK